MGGEVSNTKEHKREKTAAYKGEEGAKMFVWKPSTFKLFLFLSITGDGNVQESQCVQSEISICRSGDIFYYHQVKIQQLTNLKNH